MPDHAPPPPLPLVTAAAPSAPGPAPAPGGRGGARFPCRACGHHVTRVYRTYPAGNLVVRYRRCPACGRTSSTHQPIDPRSNLPVGAERRRDV